MFIPGPSLTAEKQGPGLKFSIENEIFKPRMKISSENENFVRGGMVFSCVRVRMIFFDPGALWERLLAAIFECVSKQCVQQTVSGEFGMGESPDTVCWTRFTP